MYEQREIRRKMLSTGLFRVAYGVDVVYGDGDTVREMFVQSAVALEEGGWDVQAILRDRDPISCGVAKLIVDQVDSSKADWCELPDLCLVLFGLHQLLRILFTDEDPLARGKFLKDLTSMGEAA